MAHCLVSLEVLLSPYEYMHITCTCMRMHAGVYWYHGLNAKPQSHALPGVGVLLDALRRNKIKMIMQLTSDQHWPFADAASPGWSPTMVTPSPQL